MAENVLKLNCIMASTDTVEFERFDTDGVQYHIQVNESETRSNILLGETEARALFNWLGVQLHKGGS